MMMIENKFEIGQMVYLKTDTDQYPRLVVRITISFIGITYGLAFGQGESMHFEIEISEQKDALV